MTLFEQALRVAVAAHRDQERKSDGSPYVVHPIMCAFLLQAHGFREVVLAAALVHDVLEDTSVTEGELRELLGDEVVDIVLTVTEDGSLTGTSDWEARKQAYIESVRQGSDDAKAVAIADKIHNMRSLLDAYATEGPALWEKFNRGRDAKLWFEDSMLAMFRETWQHPLIDEYAQLVERLRIV